MDPEALTRTRWEEMSNEEQDLFIHEHVMDGQGHPLAYTTNFEAANSIMTKLGLLYEFKHYPIKDGDPQTKWHCRVNAKVESLQSSYTWAAATFHQALCLATMHALDLLICDDSRDLRSLD